MKLFDSVKDLFRVDYDDYEDDYYYDDDYEDDDQVEASYDDIDDSSSQKESRTTRTSAPKPKKTTTRAPRAPKAPKPRRSSFRSSRQSANISFEVCVIKPNSYDDTQEIADTLLAGKAVVLNFEGVNLDISQRIIDFVSGSTYSIAGNLQRVSGYIYLVTPSTIDITGDLMEFVVDFNQKASTYNKNYTTSTYNRPNY